MRRLFNRHKNNDEEVIEKSSSKLESYEIRQAIVDAVLGMFRQIERKNSEGANYVLGIETNDILFNDLILLENANGLGLRKELLNGLYKRGFEIGDIEIKQGKIDGNPMRCSPNNVPDLVLFLERITAESVSEEEMTKARITLAPGSPGGLKKPKGYIIYGEKAPYNIGRVIMPGDGSNRVNHIEIEDDTRHVSRTHSHICYSKTTGFYIQREKPTASNLVEVIKNKETKVLNNDKATVILEDGDKIRLSSIVVLEFHKY